MFQIVLTMSPAYSLTTALWIQMSIFSVFVFFFLETQMLAAMQIAVKIIRTQYTSIYNTWQSNVL